MLREPNRASAWVRTWTLTPGGDGERTMMPLTVALRDPQINGRLARARTRRALRRLAAAARARRRGSRRAAVADPAAIAT
jgi:hypothetical protein